MDKTILKVYPAKFWHDDVVIIGNRQGLTKLKEVIDAALSGELGTAVMEETDGSAYCVNSRMHDGDILDEKWLELPMHYDDGEISQEEQEFLSQFLLSDKSATPQT